ncbi:MAG: phosphatase PAP2-related protein [Minisyncoccia bacterium]
MEAYRQHFSNKDFIFSFFEAIVLIVVALMTQFYASNYATNSASSSVADIVLSNTRVYDVGGIFVYGAVFLTFFILYLCFRHINYLPFVMKSIAIFTLTRSFFITLTHINPFPTHATIDSVIFGGKMFNGIFNGDDLFFSGHTGLPFLLALIFWDHKSLRYIFLTFSIVFGVVVLLGHLHYTIDVFSAFFITYTIFHICLKFLRKDRELFQRND